MNLCTNFLGCPEPLAEKCSMPGGAYGEGLGTQEGEAETLANLTKADL